MLDFHVLTIFPEMFESFTTTSICKRAIEAGLIGVECLNFRDFTTDKHRRVDDAPFGGGAGMLIAPQSVFDCFAHVHKAQEGKRSVNIYMSPAGETLSTSMAQELAGYDHVNILCGHYEGVDQRILDHLIDREISIGDYVLTGGELPAMVLMDCVMRHVDGVLGNQESTGEESFSDSNAGLLEYPQYTRPADFRGMGVPEVLLSGHHANIKAWQRREALKRTAQRRQELLEKAELTAAERKEFLK
ncbi:MAG: tRNA (guanosine(37)-N1)-methyltransferase TrmD [Christensenellaceae bacterium]|nr:tRNA (guanosine(37)-N1)-methyltransferase TrmD [Christensenellaceae bacterium]